MCSVDLIETPEKVFGRSVYVVSAGIVWEIVAKR